jgi:hypothetical protein
MIIMFSMLILFMIDIFYPSGELISPHLLCCKGFAVDNHRPDLTNQTSSFAPRADPT